VRGNIFDRREEWFDEKCVKISERNEASDFYKRETRLNDDIYRQKRKEAKK